MTYRLKFGEPASKSWRRIVGEQIALARDLLSSGRDVDTAIHETRKAMKRVRALLRLLRSGLTGQDYKREKARYGDIARLLAGARDDAVLAATAGALSRQTMGKARLAAEALATARAQIAVGDKAARAAVDARDVAPAAKRIAKSHEKAARVREAIAALDAAESSLGSLKIRQRTFDVVRQGLADSYRDGRRAMKRAYRSDVDEDFHEWRKAVQAHWRHMLLVARAWPDMFEARAQLAKEMSELLGEDHDLYVLIHAAEANVQSGAAAAAQDGLVRAARARQDTLRKALEVKGKALFAEPADRFVARVDAYWTAAKAARKLTHSHPELEVIAAPATMPVAVARAGPSGAAGGKQVSRKDARGVRAKRASAAKAKRVSTKKSEVAKTNGVKKRRTRPAGKTAPPRKAGKRTAATRRKSAARGKSRGGRGGTSSRRA